MTDRLPMEVRANRVLAGLPDRVRAKIEPQLEPVVCRVRHEVYQPHEPITHVHFPTAGVFSIVSLMAEGQSVEVATVGDEGFLGVPVFLGAESASLQAFCQVEGAALRIPAQSFRRLVDAHIELRERLMLYTQGLFTQVGQTAACNRAHDAQQRCARWLLMTSDRVHDDQFLLTQEFLGQMLGVRRATVSETASALQDQGLIEYTRGEITILDRRRLERAACECYAMIRDEYTKLLGPTGDDGDDRFIPRP